MLPAVKIIPVHSSNKCRRSVPSASVFEEGKLELSVYFLQSVCWPVWGENIKNQLSLFGTLALWLHGAKRQPISTANFYGNPQISKTLQSFRNKFVVTTFDVHKKCVSVMISVRPAGQPVVFDKTWILQFSLTLNMVNVRLCMLVVIIELNPFVLLSVTLIAFQGHGSVKQF